MKVNHFRMFLNALRTALIIVASFIAYEMLLEMTKIWNEIYPNKHYNFLKSKLYKLVIIFIFDLFLLYMAYIFFEVEL